MTSYVCGFLFSPDRKRVVLINKLKPEWQKGRYNGVGGKIEDGETPWAAMVREFQEETGVEIETWDEVFLIENENFVVYFFRAFGPVDDVKTLTDEQVSVWSVDGLPDVLPNLKWVIPLSLDEEICSGEMSLESVQWKLGGQSNLLNQTDESE